MDAKTISTLVIIAVILILFGLAYTRGKAYDDLKWRFDKQWENYQADVDRLEKELAEAKRSRDYFKRQVVPPRAHPEALKWPELYPPEAPAPVPPHETKFLVSP